MLKLRGEKILFTIAMIFVALGIFLNWVSFIYFAGAIILLGAAVSIVSLLVTVRTARGSIKTIIFCEKCGKLLALTPMNLAPEYNLAGEEILRNDTLDFYLAHSGHEISHLQVVWGPCRRSLDPMAISYLVARHGSKLFFIKRSRESIHAPLDYEFVSAGQYGWYWRLLDLALK